MIELSVAVIFVMVLLFVGLNVFEDVKVKNRDNRRVSDIKELQKGLELYRTTTSRFPISSQQVAVDGTDIVSKTLIGERIFSTIPTDPLHPQYAYEYQSDADGTAYVLIFCQETDSNPSYKQGCENFARP